MSADLGDDIVDGRLETGGRFSRNVVLDFIESIADGEFGRDFGDGKAGRLGRQLND
ncbi:MAG: hypothetical protein U1D30_13755 [Planctomycetota bacterium]